MQGLQEAVFNFTTISAGSCFLRAVGGKVRLSVISSNGHPSVWPHTGPPLPPPTPNPMAGNMDNLYNPCTSWQLIPTVHTKGGALSVWMKSSPFCLSKETNNKVVFSLLLVLAYKHMLATTPLGRIKYAHNLSLVANGRKACCQS